MELDYIGAALQQNTLDEKLMDLLGFFIMIHFTFACFQY